MSSSRLKAIEKEKEKLEKQIVALIAEKNSILSRKTLQCVKSNYGNGCGAEHRLEN